MNTRPQSSKSIVNDFEKLQKPLAHPINLEGLQKFKELKERLNLPNPTYNLPMIDTVGKRKYKK